MNKPKVMECERMMERDGVQTEVHENSVAIMQGLGWSLVKGQAKVPEVAKPATPEPSSPHVATQRTAEEVARRAEEDEGAKNATVAELKAALDTVKVPYTPDMKKADLLAAFLARP